MIFRILLILFYLISASFAKGIPYKAYKLFQVQSVDQSVRAYFLVHNPAHNALTKVAIYADALEWTVGSQNFRIPIPKDYLYFVASPGKKYIGFVYQKKSPGKTEPGQLEIAIVDDTGVVFPAIRFPHYFDEPFPAFAISDREGASVLGQATTGTLWFYDSNGRLLREVDLFQDDDYALERSLQIAVAGDGGRVAVLATKQPASPTNSGVSAPSGQPTLFLFDINGEKIWQHLLPQTSGGSVAISPNGKHIFVSCYSSDLSGKIARSTVLFDDSGNEQAEYDLLFRKAHFSPDGTRAVLIDNHIATQINLVSTRKVWQFKTPKPEILTDARLSAGGQIAVLLSAKNEFRDGKFVFEEPRIIILQNDGTIRQSLNASGTFYQPAISLSRDAHSIYLGLLESFRTYSTE